jgi:hypothetical protein
MVLIASSSGYGAHAATLPHSLDVEQVVNALKEFAELVMNWY